MTCVSKKVSECDLDNHDDGKVPQSFYFGPILIIAGCGWKYFEY